LEPGGWPQWAVEVPFEPWNAGPEHDAAVLARLKRALIELGYRPSKEWWGVGGSQEIAHWEFTGDLGQLTVESETYMGVTITGADTVLAQLRARMASPAD
jgi:hypothetical protein